jgi:hypothetical protein
LRFNLGPEEDRRPDNDHNHVNDNDNDKSD